MAPAGAASNASIRLRDARLARPLRESRAGVGPISIDSTLKLFFDDLHGLDSTAGHSRDRCPIRQQRIGSGILPARA
ncbi:MAG: hypothetical protein ABJD97_14600 [Betaproteobacteria bacterium]